MPVNEDSGFVSALRKRATLIAGVFGVALAAIGAALGIDCLLGVLTLGVGTSLIAAAFYTLLAEFRQEFADRLLEQGLVDLFPSRLRRFEEGFWPNLIDSTNDHYRVLGVANHGYMRREEPRQESRRALLAALERGVVVEILWLNPERRLAADREREEKRATRRDIVDSIDWFWNLRKGLGEDLQARLRLKLHAAIPSCGLTWADDRLIVTHYIAGQNNLDSPGMVLSTSALGLFRPLRRLAPGHTRRAALAQAYINTYKEVEAQATELSETGVAALLLKRPTWDTGDPSEGDLRETLQNGEA
jgi:hypothetical protein